jgi:hypothetical protein
MIRNTQLAPNSGKYFDNTIARQFSFRCYLKP